MGVITLSDLNLEVDSNFNPIYEKSNIDADML